MPKGEVTIAGLAFLEKAEARFGLPVDRLIEGLPVRREDFHRIDKRIPWDVLVEVCERIQAEFGAQATRDAGRCAVEGDVFRNVRRIAGLFVDTRDIYRSSLFWIAPSMFPTVKVGWEADGDRSFVVTLEIREPYRGSTAWMNLVAGGLEGIPEILGLPPAKVTAEISPRRTRYVVTPPDRRPRRRGLVQWLRSAANAIDELADQAEELRRSREARQQAVEALESREHTFANLLENLSAMGYRCSPDGRHMEVVSQGCRAITGYGPEAFLGAEALPFDDVVFPDDKPGRQLRRAASLVARETCSSEYRILTRTGEVRWVLDIGDGTYDEGGSLVAIEGVIVDITEKRKLEERLSHVHRLEAIGQLAGSVAHDFNNLLTAVLGATDLALLALPLDHPARRDVADAHAAAQRGSALTKQLLAFARQRPIEPRLLDVGALVQGVFGILARVVGGRIKLETRIGVGLWPVVADGGQLEQVIINLAANARDAMIDGGELTISVMNAEIGTSTGAGELRPGEYVVIRVEDTGTGISPHILGRVFEPFFTTKLPGQGTGLGLASSYATVVRAGGHIGLESQVGSGTCVSVYLPRAASTAAISSSGLNTSANGNAVIPSRANETGGRGASARAPRPR
ncbi:MAG: PAS domain-containing protein [Polyangiaceae bacterium]|nr:PAS domain-containing protein [Polyangiaceae bacterium]